jgi:hypothetical protein
MARNVLGETFGTLKRKQAIRALERNKVHGNTLTGVEDVLRSTIDQSSEALPDKGRFHNFGLLSYFLSNSPFVINIYADLLKQEQDQNRPIPPFNAQVRF